MYKYELSLLSLTMMMCYHFLKERAPAEGSLKKSYETLHGPCRPQLDGRLALELAPTPREGSRDGRHRGRLGFRDSASDATTAGDDRRLLDSEESLRPGGMPCVVLLRGGFLIGGLPSSFLGPDGMLCVVLWRPEALDCRVLITPETRNGFTQNPPNGIRTPKLLHLRANTWPLDYRDHYDCRFIMPPFSVLLPLLMAPGLSQG